MAKCGKLSWSKSASMSRNRVGLKYEYEARSGGMHFRVLPRSDVYVRRGYQLQVAHGKGQFAIKGDFRTPQAAKARASRLACKASKGRG